MDGLDILVMNNYQNYHFEHFIFTVSHSILRENILFLGRIVIS